MDQDFATLGICKLLYYKSTSHIRVSKIVICMELLPQTPILKAFKEKLLEVLLR